MIHIKETIIVEGKYDKERVKRLCDAPVLCTDGFRIFRTKGMVDTIRNLAASTGIIVMTDSDRAGFKIRSYIKSCVGGRGRVKHAYIPSIEGKEKRKDKPGKEGILGVEGMDDSVLEGILNELASENDNAPQSHQLTKAELFGHGLSGKPDSFSLRQQVLKELNLPLRLSPNAMVEFINKADMYEEYINAVEAITRKDNTYD